MLRLKILVLFSMAVGLTDTASAADLAAFGANSPYTTIKQWHATGEKAYYNNMEEHYEGRCFTSRNDAIGEIVSLSIASKEVERNAGPAFPNQSEAKVVILSVADVSKLNVRELKTAVYSEWNQNEISLEPYSPLLWRQGNIQGEVNKAGDYLTTLITTVSDQKCENLNPEISRLCKNAVLKKGTLLWACYFFRKIID